MQEELNLKDYEKAENQLLEVQRNIGFILTEYPVEVLVAKMPKNSDDSAADFYIPEYQRNFSWEVPRQCKFIESLLMGLPIPFLFGYVDPKLEDRMVVVDGVQRLNTLREFVENGLRLKDLGKLDALDTFGFKDLSSLQQRRFLRRTLRMIILDETADPQTQFELFERINTGSKRPSAADIRRGAFPGPFRDLIVEFAKHPVFEEMTPMGDSKEKQREREELVARLFCYAERYKEFSHDVAFFINDFVKDKNIEMESSDGLGEKYRGEFSIFIEYAKKLIPRGGFGLGSNSTPRNQFEALAVPLLIVIRDGVKDSELDYGWVLDDKEFSALTKSGGSNSRVRLAERIEYVLKKLNFDNEEI